MPEDRSEEGQVRLVRALPPGKRDALRGDALKNPITNQNLLRILTVGFALVILVLLAAGVIGLRNAQDMHQSAARLTSEQRITAGLLQQLELEQSTMSDVIFRLLRRPGLSDEGAILGRLDQLDATLKTLREEDDGDDAPAGWEEIVAATEDFSTLARSLTRNPQRDPQSIETLFQHHQRVQRISDGILLANSRSAIADGQSLEAQANRMVTVSLSLLGACLGLAVLCAGLTLRFAASTLHQLDRQANELNRVSWQMLQGQEEAARRFSHELHDELGQSLAAVKANLMALTPGGFEERRADCIHLVDDSISNVRELSQLLRPVILDDFGLDAALRWLCERFQQRTGVHVSYESEVLARLPERAETHLFRITQEALTNIARHARATAVEVNLSSGGGRVWLRIADNGIGISENGNARQGETQERNGNGIGLVGMRARAVQAGGTLSIRTPEAGGVEVMADLPLEHTTDDLST
ncbi:MAG: hypothetical protein IT170_06080 [Bryobacterales bacterium]|nr:hypothetical protein [Bryobacterales bacterium]